MHRRNLDEYEGSQINGVEVMTLPELSRHVVNLQIDLRSFLFFRNLKAVVVLDNGMVIGRSPYGAQSVGVEG